MARRRPADAAARARRRRLGRPPRVRHRMATPPVRGRVRGHQLADRVRRPGSHARRAAHLPRGDHPRRGPLRRGELRGHAARRADDHDRGHPRAEGRAPTSHPARRRGLVPGLQRAQRRQRPRLAELPWRARRRRVRDQRPEDVDELRPGRRLVRDADPHRSRGAQAQGHHVGDVPDGHTRHRDPADPHHRRQHRVQRGVLRRGPGARSRTGSGSRTTVGGWPW